MRTIYKYPLPFCTGDHSVQTIDGPILSAQLQSDCIAFWVLGDSETLTRRKLRIVGTGWPTGCERVERLEHVATMLMGAFVWHMFEVRDAETEQTMTEAEASRGEGP